MVPFLCLAIVLVVGRLFSIRSAKQVPWYLQATVWIFQCIAAQALLQASTRSKVFVFASFTILALLPSLFNYQLGKPDVRILVWRLAVLALGMIVFGFLAKVGSMSIRPEARAAVKWFASHCAPGHTIDRVKWSVTLSRTLGVLICIREAGELVALVMCLSGVEAPADVESHFTHSALIGSVERILIFIFVTNNQYNAVAFILTAKGVVRLHDTVKGKAAEYVLIGTLYSTLSAIAVTLTTSLLP